MVELEKTMAIYAVGLQSAEHDWSSSSTQFANTSRLRFVPAQAGKPEVLTNPFHYSLDTAHRPLFQYIYRMCYVVY